MKVMTFNVLCHGCEGHDWFDRQDDVIATVRNYMPDIFGLQEAHLDWMKAFWNNMPEYDYVGVGREDGKEEGEFSPVFYKKDKFDFIDDEWHTYGCEITEDAIRFYFDGIKFGEYSLNKDRMDMFAQLKEIRIGYNKIGVNSTIPMPDKTTVSEFEVEYIHIHQTKNLGQIADHF